MSNTKCRELKMMNRKHFYLHFYILSRKMAKLNYFVAWRRDEKGKYWSAVNEILVGLSTFSTGIITQLSQPLNTD